MLCGVGWLKMNSIGIGVGFMLWVYRLISVGIWVVMCLWIYVGVLWLFISIRVLWCSMWGWLNVM